MTIDHFIVGGAQRSGTTYLIQLLELHPQIDLARPLRPEPKFFLRDGRTAAEYDALFAGPTSVCRLRGEKSTSYLERSDAADRIAALLPEVELVFLLRDPVERAISNYRFSVDHGVETLPIGEAFRGEAARRDDYDRARFSVSPFAYLARGEYERQLQPYARRFGAEKLILVLFEDLVRAPEETLSALLTRLGADPGLLPRVPRRPVNASRSAEEIDVELRRFLVEHFAEHNRRLAGTYGLDLSSWQSR